MKDIVINRGLTKSKLIGDFPWSKTRKIVSYKLKNYQFMPAFGRGWDGSISFLTKKGSFPAGLTSRMKTGLIDLGYNVNVEYDYTLPPQYELDNIPTFLKDIKPRPYQLATVYTAINARSGILKLPTGSGKTVIAILIIKTLKQRTLFLTNRSEIMHQTYGRFVSEFGEDKVGMIGDGLRKEGNLVTIGMVQTLVKLSSDVQKKFLNSIDVFIGDEIHHAKAKTWKNVIKKCEAIYRFGLTATPGDEGEQMELEAATGPIIYEAKVESLAAEGYLTKPTAVIMSKVQEPTISDRYDYQQAYMIGITENEYRNRRIISLCNMLVEEKQTPVLVFSTTIAHLRRLTKIAKEIGMDYELLTGVDNTLKRQDTIKKMKDGKLDVLFVSTIFDEGVDIPNVGSVLMASVGKNKTKLIQRLGRGMRVAKGKDKFLVVDIFDYTCKYLKRHSNHRKNIYKKEGYQVIIGSLKRYLKSS